MLELRNIVKEYVTGDTKVQALRGVSLKFRKNEFVAILGSSGCGKTTMLNIVGGLDRYTSGDLLINGISTKQYKDSDWDSYRNHSIGFVFQSYNLIPHQTVLSNVELALTLSGVSKAERRARAIEALKKVGLGDQIHKKPNQMSGGQMQRVAIARALVNNPDILLADEPTGALDTQTSVQIMDLLKEVAEDRLVIMVTHNPELADEYATRIVKLRDGEVLSDSCPLIEDVVAVEEATEVAPSKGKKAKLDKAAKKAKKKNKTSMSFATALSLSLNNLMTKKTRTALTSFAGSIGIVGIALILSLSNGIQLYIDQVQEDALSTYPLSVMQETSDLNAVMSAMTEVEESEGEELDPNKIYVDDSMGKMVSALMSTKTNNLEKFKEHIDAHKEELAPYINDIQYTYDLNLQVYNIVPDVDEDGKEYNRVTKLGLGSMLDSMGDSFAGMSELASSSGMMDVMSEMIDNQELLDQQYEVVEGEWPKEANEVVLVVSKDNKVSRMTLYMLGILDQGELDDIMKTLMEDKELTTDPIEPFDFDDFIGSEFYLVNTSDFYEKTDKTYKVEGSDKEYPVWNDVREKINYDDDQESFITENGMKLKISGIIRPRAEAAATSISSPIAYTKMLTDKVLDMNTESEVINQQKETPEYNVLTGIKFEKTKYTPETIKDLIDKIDDSTMEMFYAYMTTEILSNEEFSDRINVTKDSFIGMFMLMPEENQQQIFEAVLGAASAQNPTAVDSLCRMVSIQTNGITVTKENFVRLMPVLDIKTVMFAFVGVPAGTEYNGMKLPMAIPGLTEIAGEATMNQIYSGMTESFKKMTITEDIFVTLLSTMDANDKDFIMIEEALYKMAPQTDATVEKTLEELGDAQEAKPASINFYAKDFASKEVIETFISDYNDEVEEEDKIEYTDVIGIMLSSVALIIDIISYVLIAFVSISLVVSSIMIGIITYISVLERTKEIGILRSIGASKKDISRVFNAETMIIGFCAGFIGVVGTLLLCIPINAIIHAVSGVDNVSAQMPWAAAVILVVISIVLTLVAGLLPSRIASKKEPVEALRTE